jgi:hypothetical protein
MPVWVKSSREELVGQHHDISPRTVPAHRTKYKHAGMGSDRLSFRSPVRDIMLVDEYESLRMCQK